MNNWSIPNDVELVDIKQQPLSSSYLAEMYKLAGSYEELFSKRSQTFIARGLKNQIKTDEDYGFFLPQDYTFLKRPVLVYKEKIFIGNSPKTAQEVRDFLMNL